MFVRMTAAASLRQNDKKINKIILLINILNTRNVLISNLNFVIFFLRRRCDKH